MSAGSSPTVPVPVLAAAYFAAFLSGATGLSYEVIWSRMLVVPLGNSTDAAAVVLFSFMLGMAIGARALGGLADRLRSPFALYAMVEVGLGLWALAMPALLGSLDAALPSGGHREIGLAVGAATVLLPSAAMGASIPVLVRALTRTAGDVPRRVGPIYGLNTAGGALGAAFAGFAAAPSLGLSAASTLTACATFAAAAAAALAGRLARSPASDAAAGIAPADSPEDRNRPAAFAALATAFLCGLVVLAAEMLWARTLTFVFGHDTYAFAILLVVALAGLGLGGLGYRLLSRRDPGPLAANLLALLGAAVAGSFWAASQLVVSAGRDPFGLSAREGLGADLWVELYREAAYTPVLVLLPALISGACLPAAIAAHARSTATAGGRAGAVLLANGIGSAVGAPLATFALIALLGIGGSIFLVAGIAAAAAVPLALAAAAPGSRRRAALPAAIASAAALAIVVAAPGDLPRRMLLEAVGARHQEILHYEEGRTGTVSVTENRVNGERQLFMNAVNEVTTRLVHDQSFALLGHLGPLLHPDPERGLMICLGAGLSAGAALSHPLHSLDVVELSPAMPRAARLFEEENGGVLGDPRLRLHTGDGRQFLLSSGERYDVIIVDSTHPKAVDSWILYTKEFYELARDHLEEDGIAVQWVPLHGLSENEQKVIARTFLSVFPEATFWVNAGFEPYGQAAYLKMMGTLEPLEIDYRELDLRVREPRIRESLAPHGLDGAAEILDCFLAGPDAARRWTDGLPVQTDDRPFLPYITDLTRGRRMEARLLLAARSSVLPLLRRMGEREPEIRERLARGADAQGFLLAGLLDRAVEALPGSSKIRMSAEAAGTGPTYYRDLAGIYRDDPIKLFEIGSYLGNLGHPEDSIRLYEEALALSPGDRRIRINLALARLDLGEADRAARELAAVVDESGGDALARYDLGVALVASGDASAGIDHLERALELEPDMTGAELALADALLDLGDADRAQRILRRSVRREPWIAEAWDMLGLVEASRGRWNAAKRHHSRALALDPFRAAAHYNMGIALQEEGRLGSAAAAYEAALRIRPDDAEALNNLGLVHAATGRLELAAKEHRMALEADPAYAKAAYNLGLDYLGMGNSLAAAEAFALALAISPGLAPARARLDDLGLDDARVEIVDGGAPDGGPLD